MRSREYPVRATRSRCRVPAALSALIASASSAVPEPIGGPGGPPHGPPEKNPSSGDRGDPGDLHSPVRSFLRVYTRVRACDTSGACSGEVGEWRSPGSPGPPGPRRSSPGNRRSRTMGNMAGVAVPRVIHWWWDGPPVPPEYVRFRERWAELHPGWTLQVWDETRFLAEFENHPATQLYRARDRWSPHAHEWGWKTNIARLLILQRDGGLWADADLEPLKPVDPLIERLEASENHNALAALEDRHHINNAFLASPPDGPFIVA